MKRMRSAIMGLAACGLVFGLASTLRAQSVVQGQATVVKMKGEARYTDGKSGWRPLKVGDVLAPGTLVQTEQAKSSYVDLVLGDSFSGAAPTPVVFNPSAAAAHASGISYSPVVEQNVVRLWENTIVGIDKLTAQQTGADTVTDTELDLKAGHIMGMVKKMSRASKYEIKLPKGVAGIRGTLYELWANGSGSVSAGSMVISLLDAQDNPHTTVLNGGEQFDAPTGTKSMMPDSVQHAFDRAIGDLKVTQLTLPPPQVPDTTIIQYVSPTHGKGHGHGHGHGNGNGDGNID